MLVPVGASLCANDALLLARKSPASRNPRHSPYLSLKETSLTQVLLSEDAKGQYPKPAHQSGQAPNTPEINWMRIVAKMETDIFAELRRMVDDRTCTK
jgi:hypothetical protein